jgi:hypothetical protein
MGKNKKANKSSGGGRGKPGALSADGDEKALSVEKQLRAGVDNARRNEVDDAPAAAEETDYATDTTNAAAMIDSVSSPSDDAPAPTGPEMDLLGSSASVTDPGRADFYEMGEAVEAVEEEDAAEVAKEAADAAEDAKLEAAALDQEAAESEAAAKAEEETRLKNEARLEEEEKEARLKAMESEAARLRAEEEQIAAAAAAVAEQEARMRAAEVEQAAAAAAVALEEARLMEEEQAAAAAAVTLEEARLRQEEEQVAAAVAAVALEEARLRDECIGAATAAVAREEARLREEEQAAAAAAVALEEAHLREEEEQVAATAAVALEEARLREEEEQIAAAASVAFEEARLKEEEEVAATAGVALEEARLKEEEQIAATAAVALEEARLREEEEQIAAAASIAFEEARLKEEEEVAAAAAVALEEARLKEAEQAAAAAAVALEKDRLRQEEDQVAAAAAVAQMEARLREEEDRIGFAAAIALEEARQQEEEEARLKAEADRITAAAADTIEEAKAGAASAAKRKVEQEAAVAAAVAVAVADKRAAKDRAEAADAAAAAAAVALSVERKANIRMMQQSQLAVAEKRAAEDRANAAGAAAATAAAASATAAAALSAERKARIRMMQQSQLGSLQGSSGEARASPTSDRVNADAGANVIAPRGAGDLVDELGMDVSPTQITDSLPAVPSFDVLRKRRFVSDEPYLRRRPEDTLAHAELARLGSGLPGDDPGTGMGAKQKNEHEELTDDLFDDSPHTYARLFKRNLATTSVVLLIVSLLVYTCMDPVATDFVWKLSLSSPLNERLAFRDPKHKLHIVNSEAMAVRGTWWRLESLEGSAKPSVYHNQWDLAGVQFFSDYACEIPVTQSSKGVDGSLAKETVSALLTSESTHHEWHQTRPGWGFLEANGGAYINEPQSGGSRVSVHITGQDAITMPRCVAFASCAGEPAVAVPSAGVQRQQQQRQPGRRLLKKKKLPPVKAERKREKVKAEVTAIDLGVAAATADAMESLPALYNGETEAACAPEHFPASMQLAVFDAAADSWTEVLRFNESEMLEVTGGVAGSLRTMLVPEAGGVGGCHSRRRTRCKTATCRLRSQLCVFAWTSHCLCVHDVTLCVL